MWNIVYLACILGLAHLPFLYSPDPPPWDGTTHSISALLYQLAIKKTHTNMFTGQSYGGHSSIRVSLPWHTNLTIETHYGTAFMILDSVMLTILATMSLSFVTRHANIITHKSQSSSLSLHRFLDLLALNTNHHTELGTQKDDTSVK